MTGGSRAGRAGHRLVHGAERRASPQRLVLACHGKGRGQVSQAQDTGLRSLSRVTCTTASCCPGASCPPRPDDAAAALGPLSARRCRLPAPHPRPSAPDLSARRRRDASGWARVQRSGPAPGRLEKRLWPGRAVLASRCRATASSPRRGPAAVLPSPAVSRALPLARPALRSAPIERPPPLPRPHWRAALWPRRVTFSHHSPRLLRQLRAARRAGPGHRQL